MRSLLSWGFALVVLALLAATLAREGDKLARLATIAPGAALLLVLLCLLLFMPNGLCCAMAAHFGVELAFTE